MAENAGQPHVAARHCAAEARVELAQFQEDALQLVGHLGVFPSGTLVNHQGRYFRQPDLALLTESGADLWTGTASSAIAGDIALFR